MAASLSDYTALITSEHRDKPRFMATVGALVQPIVDQMNVLQSMPGKFDLDNAVGVQLDDVGLWVGVSRKIRTPLTGIYFSFDIDGLGFDQGTWKGPFDPDTGLTVLDDDTYRLVIRAKIGANRWDGTLESSAAILNSIFGNPSSDLVPVHANGEVFGTGDGVTKNFPLTYGGAQVRRVDNATLYRNDWQGNQLLYPTARTNLLKYSQDLTQNVWSESNASIAAGATTGPDGVSGAAKLVENTATSLHLTRYTYAYVAGTTYTATLYLKAAERAYATFLFFDGSGNIASFQLNLLTGQVVAGGTSLSGATCTLTSLQNGWWAASITATAPIATSGTFFDLRMANVWPITSVSGMSYAGDGVSGMYIFGGQLETGSIATSYIPTTTAAVTVTDYVLSSSGVAQLGVAPAPGAKLSWTGDGEVYQQGTRVFIEDHQDMSMTIGIAGKVPSAVFLALLAGGYIPLKPEGVRVAYTIVTTVDGAPMFGFDMNNQFVAGFDSGAWGKPV
ncbi:DUF2612 domain-containing protein [Burkholderia multivorans]|nr:DUF2612 domain-containing protein [Burkholderia multivorans]